VTNGPVSKITECGVLHLLGTAPKDGEEMLVTSVVNLNHPGHYLHWGVVQLSVANFVVIITMLAVFALAIFLPFPKKRNRS
jgi:hypothetical protein